MAKTRKTSQKKHRLRKFRADEMDTEEMQDEIPESQIFVPVQSHKIQREIESKEFRPPQLQSLAQSPAAPPIQPENFAFLSKDEILQDRELLERLQNFRKQICPRNTYDVRTCNDGKLPNFLIFSTQRDNRDIGAYLAFCELPSKRAFLIMEICSIISQPIPGLLSMLQNEVQKNQNFENIMTFVTLAHPDRENMAEMYVTSGFTNPEYSEHNANTPERSLLLVWNQNLQPDKIATMQLVLRMFAGISPSTVPGIPQAPPPPQQNVVGVTKDTVVPMPRDKGLSPAQEQQLYEFRQKFCGDRKFQIPNCNDGKWANLLIYMNNNVFGGYLAFCPVDSHKAQMIMEICTNGGLRAIHMLIQTLQQLVTADRYENIVTYISMRTSDREDVLKLYSSLGFQNPEFSERNAHSEKEPSVMLVWKQNTPANIDDTVRRSLQLFARFFPRTEQTLESIESVESEPGEGVVLEPYKNLTKEMLSWMQQTRAKCPGEFLPCPEGEPYFVAFGKSGKIRGIIQFCFVSQYPVFLIHDVCVPTNDVDIMSLLVSRIGEYALLMEVKKIVAAAPIHSDFSENYFRSLVKWQFGNPVRNGDIIQLEWNAHLKYDPKAVMAELQQLAKQVNLAPQSLESGETFEIVETIGVEDWRRLNKLCTESIPRCDDNKQTPSAIKLLKSGKVVSAIFFCTNFPQGVVYIMAVCCSEKHHFSALVQKMEDWVKSKGGKEIQATVNAYNKEREKYLKSYIEMDFVVMKMGQGVKSKAELFLQWVPDGVPADYQEQQKIGLELMEAEVEQGREDPIDGKVKIYEKNTPAGVQTKLNKLRSVCDNSTPARCGQGTPINIVLWKKSSVKGFLSVCRERVDGGAFLLVDACAPKEGACESLVRWLQDYSAKLKENVILHIAVEKENREKILSRFAKLDFGNPEYQRDTKTLRLIFVPGQGVNHNQTIETGTHIMQQVLSMEKVQGIQPDERFVLVPQPKPAERRILENMMSECDHKTMCGGKEEGYFVFLKGKEGEPKGALSLCTISKKNVAIYDWCAKGKEKEETQIFRMLLEKFILEMERSGLVDFIQIALREDEHMEIVAHLGFQNPQRVKGRVNFMWTRGKPSSPRKVLEVAKEEKKAISQTVTLGKPLKIRDGEFVKWFDIRKISDNDVEAISDFRGMCDTGISEICPTDSVPFGYMTYTKNGKLNGVLALCAPKCVSRAECQGMVMIFEFCAFDSTFGRVMLRTLSSVMLENKQFNKVWVAIDPKQKRHNDLLEIFANEGYKTPMRVTETPFGQPLDHNKLELVRFVGQAFSSRETIEKGKEMLSKMVEVLERDPTILKKKWKDEKLFHFKVERLPEPVADDISVLRSECDSGMSVPCNQAFAMVWYLKRGQDMVAVLGTCMSEDKQVLMVHDFCVHSKEPNFRVGKILFASMLAHTRKHKIASAAVIVDPETYGPTKREKILKLLAESGFQKPSLVDQNSMGHTLPRISVGLTWFAGRGRSFDARKTVSGSLELLTQAETIWKNIPQLPRDIEAKTPKEFWGKDERKKLSVARELMGKLFDPREHRDVEDYVYDVQEALDDEYVYKKLPRVNLKKDLPLKELRKMCKERGISWEEHMNKDELVGRCYVADLLDNKGQAVLQDPPLGQEFIPVGKYQACRHKTYCLKSGTHNRCVRPNHKDMWYWFWGPFEKELKDQGKKSLKEAYSDHIRGKSQSELAKEACDFAMKRGKQQFDKLGDLDDICRWIMLVRNRPLAQDRDKMRDRIMNKLTQDGTFHTKDITVDDLNKNKVTQVLSLINREFYDNQLWSLLKRSMEISSPEIHIKDINGGYGQFQYKEALIPDKKGRGAWMKKAVFIIDSRKFKKDLKGKKFDGITMRNSLEALIVTLCHLMTHALLLTCPSEWARTSKQRASSSGHHKRFRYLNHQLWGHSRGTTNFADEGVVVI